MRIQGVQTIKMTENAALARCRMCDVRRRSLCGALKDDDLASLAAAVAVRDVAEGQVFITEGDPADNFYNVTSGVVKLFKSLPDGRQQITGFAGVGHFLGLAASTTYGFSAEAIEPVRVCWFSRSNLSTLLDDFPSLERRLLQTACDELVAAQDTMLLLGRKTARERVASFLIARSLDMPPPGEAPMCIHLPMSRTEIADYLGLTIETVSRTLSQFKAEHRIRMSSAREVVILDRGWMHDVATCSSALNTAAF